MRNNKDIREYAKSLKNVRKTADDVLQKHYEEICKYTATEKDKDLLWDYIFNEFGTLKKIKLKKL